MTHWAVVSGVVLCKSRPSQALALICTLIVCLSVFLTGRACGNCFPSQFNPIDGFSFAARDPLFNGKAIVDDVLARSARSALATVLMEQWAWGEIAGPQVQHMAQAAITYGSQHLDLLRLASLGSNGVCLCNCHSGLQRLLTLSDNMANIVAMALPLETTQGEVETVNVPTMPLHRLLACCYEHHRHAFTSRFGGLEGAFVTFREGVEPDDPKLMAWALALAQKPSYRTHCIHWHCMEMELPSA